MVNSQTDRFNLIQQNNKCLKNIFSPEQTLNYGKRGHGKEWTKYAFCVSLTHSYKLFEIVDSRTGSRTHSSSPKLIGRPHS
jgi:hypothetical protein